MNNVWVFPLFWKYLISYEGFFFFVSKVEHARGMLCEPFLCVPKVDCERSLSFFVVDCSTFKSVFSIKGVFLLIKSIVWWKEWEYACVCISQGLPFFIHVYLLSICFTSRRKASHLAMTHHTLFYSQFDSPKKSRQLHEVKESPSNNDDKPFFGGKFWNFVHGIIYLLLTHFPIITIFPDLMSLGNYIPAKMGNMSTILNTFELLMKCASFLQSTSS